jgi:hypothetical protein
MMDGMMKRETTKEMYNLQCNTYDKNLEGRSRARWEGGV